MLHVRVGAREYTVSPTEFLTIGRDPSANIVLTDPHISRHHARIRADEWGWLIEDLGSTHGTFYRGKPITSVRIPDSDYTFVRMADPHSGVLLGMVAQSNAQHEENDGPGADSASAIATWSLGGPTAERLVNEPVLRIGRALSNDIVVDDLRVSRRHAELRRLTGGRYMIVDLHSSNGTFVNGTRISEAVLTDADYVTVGHHLFRFVGDTLEEYVDTGEGAFDVSDVSVMASRGRTLVDRVSFALDGRGFMAIVGPSGAGKSTLLAALTMFRPANSGSVYYAGRDLYASYEDLRQRIGYVPQDDIVHEHLTIRRALSFAGDLRFADDVPAKEREQRVDEVIAELGLSDRADMPIRQLSGGQRKRVSIGLELLTKPSLLFLDEPTSGLDPGNEKTLMELLRGLANDGRTVVVVTHSVQSLELCDRVLFLSPGGKVAFFGPPRCLLDYFDQPDYAGVFQRLENEHETDWRERFRADPLHEEYVQRPLDARAHERTSRRPDSVPAPPPISWPKQAWTLTRRYLSVMAGDRQRLFYLILQAPVLGALILLFAPTGQFDPAQPDHRRAGMVAVLIVLSVTLMGAVNAIREIVKESAIYRRERAFGLAIPAYLSSKFVVLAFITVVQAAVFTVIAIQRQGWPGNSITKSGGLVELVAGVALAGLASMALALLVSSMFTESDRAQSFLILILVPQIMFSGALIPVYDSVMRRFLSALVSSQWGFSAVASTVDINRLMPGLVDHPPPWWSHERPMWMLSASALVLMIILAALGAGLSLRRRDPASPRGSWSIRRLLDR